MKLNVGCGQDVRDGFINFDKVPYDARILKLNIDEELLSRFSDDSCDEIVCHGCLTEFKTDALTIMCEFWRVLKNGGVASIRLAVVDGGVGPFRDPTAYHQYSSQWIQYFIRGGMWQNSGHGFGFRGEFELLQESLGGEVHHVILKAIK